MITQETGPEAGASGRVRARRLGNKAQMSPATAACDARGKNWRRSLIEKRVCEVRRAVFDQKFLLRARFRPQKEILEQQCAIGEFLRAGYLAEYPAERRSSRKRWMGYAPHMASARSPKQLKKDEKPSEKLLSILAGRHPEKVEDPLFNPLRRKGCIRWGNNFLRKAHCMFGWDWGPSPSCRTPVSGARWSCALFSGARIADIRVKQGYAGTVSRQNGR